MSDEFTVGFSSLTRGEMYPIVTMERIQSIFNGEATPGVKATILDDDLEVSTYLPKKLQASVTDQLIIDVTDAGKTDEKYKVCYYGKMEKQAITEFYGRIHKPDEGRDEKFFANMTKLIAKYGGKRKLEGSELGMLTAKMQKNDL